MTVWPLAADSVTVKVAGEVPALPSFNDTSLMLRVGVASSSVIVPVPTAAPSVALVGLVSVTVNVSLASSSRSPFTSTVTVWLVSPGANVSVPDAAAKSAPEAAVTPAAA